MFDFDVLEKKEGRVSVDGQLVRHPGEPPGAAGVGEGDEGAAAEAAERAEVLRRAVRQRSGRREPSLAALERWSQCEQARDLIRHFVLEDAVGIGESMRYRDVLRLLRALHWSPVDILTFFLGEGKVLVKADDVAMDVLRAFAGMDGEGDDRMRFRGVYRLLEVLGLDVKSLLRELAEVDYCEEPETPGELVLGKFRMLRGIGSGFNGMCIYRGEHVSTRRQVAIKWPMGKDELEVLKDIERQAPPPFLGLPQLLAHGAYGGKLYMVTELLGSPLTKVLDRLEGRSLEERWRVMRVVGRLLLRRLEAVHACGYVHCDVSPENVLLGPPRGTRGSAAKVPMPSTLSPYLIDFGLAQKHPGGEPLEGDHGSAEWSSVRSAVGARRRPEDDLEALGWLMVNGVFGDLPWFELLSKAYKTWDASRSHRAKAIRRAQEAKLQLLDGGWSSLGDEWLHLASMPPVLDRYIRSCRSDQATGLRPDYAMLSELLGGRAGLSPFDAEQADLRTFQDAVDRLL